MSKQNNIPLLEKFSIRDVSLFLGRGQSPTYTENHTKFKAINQKCVRNGKVNPAESRHHDPIIAIRETAILQNTDICINSTGNGTIGRSGIWAYNNDTIYFADSHITILRADKSKVNPKYILELLQSHDVNNKIEIYCYSGSTNQVELNSSAFASLAIQILPLDQQQTIADILTTLDNLIDHTESLIAKYQSIKQGMMHDLFTRGVDANGRLRPHSFLKHSFPNGWKILPLRDVSNISSGITLGKSISGLDTVELPYLRVANVQDGYLDLHEIKTIRIFKNDAARYSLLPGDLLLTEGGDFDKLGRGTLWNGEIPVCLHQNHIFRIRPNQSVITPQFLESIVSSSYGKRYFLNCSKQTTNLASINSSQLGAFPVPYPSIDEQHKITAPIISIIRKLTYEKSVLAKLTKLKSGLMHDLLTGTVRIPPHLATAQEPPHAL